MAFTTVSTGKPSLAEIVPYGETREVVADISKEICSEAGGEGAQRGA